MKCRTRTIKQNCLDEEGIGWPDFEIPDGAYVIEAYTRGLYRWVTYVEAAP